MALSGVSNPLTAGLGIGRPLTPPASTGVGTGGGMPARTPGVAPSVPAAPTRPASALGASAATLPAEAPAGTDPELWGVLTSEERTFFAKSAANGPLTYGRAAAGVQMLQGNAAAATAFGAAARGGRLDVRA